MARRRGRRPNATGRSESEQYVKFGYPFLRSAVFRSLSGAAVKVFLELRTRFHGNNNGQMALSLEQAATLLGMGKATVGRALAELQEKGFVVCTKRGHWYGRQASTWAVTLESIGGAVPTHDWKRWQPPKAQPAKRSRKSAKTENGSNTDPSRAMTGSEMDRSPTLGSAVAPVAGTDGGSKGSEMDR